VVFDFSCTPRIDITGLQALVDIRQVLNKYADREVEYHFVGILSPWVRRALVSESFGGNLQTSRPVAHYLEATARGGLNLTDLPSTEDDSEHRRKGKYRDEEERDTASLLSTDGEFLPVVSTNTPFFHLDIPDLHFDDE
jgi:sodium-independent sulfate anion transporter 11